MPISRKHVRLVCTKDEYEIYIASLRLRLPELQISELHSYIKRTRDVIGAAKLRRSKTKGPRLFLRKADLLSGALTRFEGRLRVLARTKPRDE
jgi:hypothetical protein